MAQKKSYSGMSGGEPLSSLRDVHIPSNALPGAALSITSTGEFGILDYSQDYFTAKALEVIPPMGAVKMGPGGVLPRTSAVEPESPVIGVSVAGAAAGEDALVLRSGKIAGKVFSPVNSVLRTLVGGTVGVAAAGTIVGTVDSSGVGYVAVGSASSGGGAVGVSAEAGNIISEKPDGLFAQAKVSLDGGNSLERRSDGLYVPESGGTSDAEFWLSQNPGKTLDDYLAISRQVLPVVQLQEGVVTKTNQKYKGRWVYKTLVKFATIGNNSNVSVAVGGFPTNAADWGVDETNSFVTAARGQLVYRYPLTYEKLWYYFIDKSGVLVMRATDDRTLFSAEVCVWWTDAQETPDTSAVGIDVSGNQYIKGDDAYQVWKNAQDPAVDTSFTAWMEAIAASLRLYPEIVASTMLSKDKNNVLALTPDGTLSVDYRTFGVEIKKNSVFLAREGIQDDRLFRIADYISETGVAFLENWIKENHPYTLPYMTGASAPSPMKATGSAQQDTSYAPWKVFDGSVYSAFHSVGSGAKWFMLDVGADICVSGFFLQRSSDTGIAHPGGAATVTLYDKNDRVLHTQGGYPFPTTANATYSGTFTKVTNGVTQKIILGVRKIRFDFASASYLTLGTCSFTAYKPPLDYALDTQSQILSVFGKYVPTGYEYYIAKEDINLAYTGEVTGLLSNLITRPTPDPIGSIRMYHTQGIPCNAIPCNVPNQLVKDAFRALHYIIGDVHNDGNTIEGNFQLPVYTEPAPSGYCWCIVVS